MQDYDRVLFGTNHLFLFHNPQDPKPKPEEPIDWEFAQQEIAVGKGFGSAADAASAGISVELREQIMELLPMVAEVSTLLLTAPRVVRIKTDELME